MFRSGLFLLLAIALLQWQTAPLAAQGQCFECELPPGCRGTGNKKQNKPECEAVAPVDLAIESDVDFGRILIVGDGVGRVLIDLSSGSKTVFGGLEDFGGISVQGHAIVTGEPMRTIRVEFPTRITLSDPTGATAEMRDFATDLPPLIALDANGQLEFHFSGTLYTDAELASGGNLRGRIPIVVEYD